MAHRSSHAVGSNRFANSDASVRNPLGDKLTAIAGACATQSLNCWKPSRGSDAQSGRTTNHTVHLSTPRDRTAETNSPLVVAKRTPQGLCRQPCRGPPLHDEPQKTLGMGTAPSGASYTFVYRTKHCSGANQNLPVQLDQDARNFGKVVKTYAIVATGGGLPET